MISAENYQNESWNIEKKSTHYTQIYFYAVKIFLLKPLCKQGLSLWLKTTMS